MNKFRLTLITSLTIFSGSAISATDGVLGTTSTGTSDVSITKESVAQITEIDDLAFGTVGFAAVAETAQSDMCVFASDTTYDITITSLNTFELQTVGGDSMAYTVAFGESAASSAVTHGTPITGLTGSTAQDCGGADNAELIVTIADTAVNAAPAGAYTDTITLLVTPQ